MNIQANQHAYVMQPQYLRGGSRMVWGWGVGGRGGVRPPGSRMIRCLGVRGGGGALSLVVATVQHMGVNRVIDTVSYWFLVHAVNATILLFDCYLR